MTDETPTPAGESAEPDGPNAAQAAFDAAKASLSSAERMIAAGALAILIVPYLLGEVIFDEYGVSYVELTMAVAALALMRTVKLRGGTVPIPYDFTLKALGYGVGVVAVFELLWFIEGGRVEDFGVVAALGYFAGAIAMVMGARQIRA